MNRAELLSLIAICSFLFAGNVPAQGLEPEAGAVPLVAGSQGAVRLPYSPTPLDFTWNGKFAPLTSTWLWWENKPRLVFSVTPNFGAWVQGSTSSLSQTLGTFGLDTRVIYRLGRVPQLFLAASLGYEYLSFPSPQPAASTVDAVAGVGLWIDIWAFSIRAFYMEGATYAFLSSGGMGGLGGYGGVEAAWALNPSVSLQLGMSFKAYPGITSLQVNNTETVGLGISYAIVPASMASPADLKGSGLQIKGLKLKDVEADKYASYATNAVGTITIRNTLGSSAKDVKVALLVPKYMKVPKESVPVKEVKSGQETSVDLFALFDQSMAEASGVSGVQAQITVTGILDGKPVSVTGMGTLKIVGSGASLVVSAPPAPAGATAAPGARAPGSASSGSGVQGSSGKGSSAAPGEPGKSVPGAASQTEQAGTSTERVTNSERKTNAQPTTTGSKTTGPSETAGRTETATTGQGASKVEPSVGTADRGAATGGSAGAPVSGGSANLAQASLPAVQQTDGTEWALEVIVASDGAATDHYGNSVSVSSDGNTIGIGAPGHAGNRGEAYVYTRNDSAWSEVRILAKDGAPSDGFGASVAIAGSGSILAVGASGKNNNQGAAYVYRLVAGKWQGAEIIASDGMPADAFGTSVALSSDGSTFAVGANGSADKRGKIYVYKGSGPARTKVTLVASDGSSGDGFGSSMALSADGSILAVGAKGKGKNAGKVYVFEWDGSWKEAGITPSDSAVAGYFGFSVALSADGTELAVGSNGAERNRGKAYLYRHLAGDWVERKVAAYDGAANDSFGASVALSADGSVLAVGAYGKEDGQGKAYVYGLSADAISESPLAETDGAAKDHFGFSLSLSSDGKELVVGSEQKAVGSTAQQGEVSVARLQPDNGP
jgi:WD40 repeat protein